MFTNVANDTNVAWKEQIVVTMNTFSCKCSFFLISMHIRAVYMIMMMSMIMMTTMIILLTIAGFGVGIGVGVDVDVGVCVSAGVVGVGGVVGAGCWRWCFVGVCAGVCMCMRASVYVKCDLAHEFDIQGSGRNFVCVCVCVCMLLMIQTLDY
jgi:hypothetical protein